MITQVQAESNTGRCNGRAYAATLIDNCADIVAVVDADGALLFANPAAERLLGVQVEVVRGHGLLHLVHPDDLEAVISALDEAVATPGLQPAITYRLRTEAGSWIHLHSVANNQLDNPDIAGIVINAHDVTAQMRLIEHVRRSQRATVSALTQVSEYRDPYTAGHQRQVADIVLLLCAAMDVDEQQTTDMVMAAALHDIGKIAIPAEILVKPGKLSDVERALVETHPRIGYDLLASVDLPEVVSEVALHHHERLDGSGYPDRLSGAAVTPASRIVAVADVADAMTSHRPYRPALGIEVALQHIASGSGTLYDADVVSVALDVLQPRAQRAGQQVAVAE